MRFDHFDILAPIYDRVIRFPSLEKILEMCGLPAAGTILDAAGGTGRVAQALQPYIDDLIVADLSHRMLLQSRQRGLKTTCTQTEKLPFPQEHFDRVLMVDAFHHVYSQSETAQELWRVLKHGGRLVIEEPDIRTFSGKFLAVAEKLALMRTRIISPQRILSLFPCENARKEYFAQDHTIWVVIHKG